MRTEAERLADEALQDANYIRDYDKRYATLAWIKVAFVTIETVREIAKDAIAAYRMKPNDK